MNVLNNHFICYWNYSCSHKCWCLHDWLKKTGSLVNHKLCSIHITSKDDIFNLLVPTILAGKELFRTVLLVGCSWGDIWRQGLQQKLIFNRVLSSWLQFFSWTRCGYSFHQSLCLLRDRHLLCSTYYVRIPINIKVK